MNHTKQLILELIGKGEKIALEFKESKIGVNNGHGGTLLLGISDLGAVLGIEPNALASIKKNFITSMNNPQKIYPQPIFQLTKHS